MKDKIYTPTPLFIRRICFVINSLFFPLILSGQCPIIFAGIYGGGPDDLSTKGEFCSSFDNNDKIPSETDYSEFCDIDPIDIINSTGNMLSGLDGIALSLIGSHSDVEAKIFHPANVSGVKDWIKSKDPNNAKVFIAGHSVGGGDVQDLAWELNSEGISVSYMAMIDSIEFGGDAIIPPNVENAVNYYQKESALIVHGEDSIWALNPFKTKIDNILIKNPVGPAPDDSDDKNYKPHRDIDNDPRVWGDFLDRINGELCISKLDFAFCIDSTGSMEDDIDAVKASAAVIINQIASSVTDYRIAVVDYRDFPVSPYGDPGDYAYNDRLPFTSSAENAVEAINAIAVGGGNDVEESVFSAIAHCIDGRSLSGWRKDAARVILIMGDAPPHDPEPFTEFTGADIVALAQTGGFVFDGTKSDDDKSGLISIWPLLVGNNPEARSAFTALADGTGGEVYEAAGADDVVEAMQDLIRGATGNGGVILEVTNEVTREVISWHLDDSSGAIIATFRLTNDFGKDGAPLEKVFWYALQEGDALKLAEPSGVTDGLAYVDVTSEVEAQLPNIGNGDLKLDFGESVTFSAAIYTYARTVPVGHIYGIWADPPIEDKNYFQYDVNADSRLDDFELLNAIEVWHSGWLDDIGVLKVIDLWRAGGYHWDADQSAFVKNR